MRVRAPSKVQQVLLNRLAAGEQCRYTNGLWLWVGQTWDVARPETVLALIHHGWIVQDGAYLKFTQQYLDRGDR